MSEKQKNMQEAPVAAIKDLYMDCVGLFAELSSEAIVTPHGAYTLTETVITPDLNGHTLKLSWQKPNDPDDPTRILKDVPLEQYDTDTGRNLWHTPINIAVFDTESGRQLNDYWISNAGPYIDDEPESGDAYDEMRIATHPDDPADAYKMTAGEVRLMGQLVEQADDEHVRRVSFLEMFKSLDDLVSSRGTEVQLVSGEDELPATFLTAKDAEDLGKQFKPDGLLYGALVPTDEGELRKADIFLSNASTISRKGILGKLVVYEDVPHGIDQEVYDIKPDNTVNGKWIHEVLYGDTKGIKSKDWGSLLPEDIQEMDSLLAQASPR